MQERAGLNTLPFLRFDTGNNGMTNTQYLSIVGNALASANSILGSPFIYNSTTYTGIISNVEISDDLGDGGWIQTLATSIVVPITTFGTAPTAGEKLSINGIEARIHKIITDEVSLELICITATK